jgi:hypothetical protein
MASIIKRDERISASQQKEIVERCNEAYDAGGAAALKLVTEAAQQIAVDLPPYSEHAVFTLYVVEAIRQKLSEAVNSPVHDEIPETPLVTL